MKKVAKVIISLSFLFGLMWNQTPTTSAAKNPFSGADSISSGVWTDGELDDEEDSNVFEFDTDADGQIYIQLGDVEGRVYVALYDEKGNKLESADTYSKSTTYLSEQTKEGTYYIQVIPSGWGNQISESTYQIKATYATKNKNHDNNFESNDTRENAYPIESGKEYKSTLDSNVDMDYYEFTTESDGDIYVNFTDVKGRLYAALIDENGNKIESVDSYSNSTTALGDTTKRGKYYLTVQTSDWGDSITNGSYAFKVTYASGVPNHNAKFESNDTKENAYRVNNNVAYTANLENNVDVDYYTFTSNKDGKLKVVLSGIKGRVYVAVYDENGNKIESVDSYSNASTSLEDDIKQGTYYIRVQSSGWGNQITNGSYAFRAIFPSAVASNATKQIYVTVDGKRVAFDQSPVTIQGRTFVPLRAIFQALSADVNWDANTRTITANKGDIQVILQVGSKTAYVNGQEITLDVPAQIINGRTLVPARFVSEAMNANVNWNSTTNTVEITTK